MLSGAKRNRNISDFSGRLGFLASLGMTLGFCGIFNAQALSQSQWVMLTAILACVAYISEGRV